MGSSIGSGMQLPACFEGDLKECFRLNIGLSLDHIHLKEMLTKHVSGKNRSMDEFWSNGFIDNGFKERNKWFEWICNG